MVKKLTILNVLEPFLNRPEQSLHLAEISRIIKEPHPTVRQWLNYLEKKGILRKEYQGRLTLFSLNKTNYDVLNYLVISEKNRLISKCGNNLVMKELVNFLIENLEENEECLIFGSAAEDFSKAEDVDLLVIKGRNEKKFNRIGSKINKELHIINVSSLKKISETLKKEVIKKHIIVKGSESIVRWMVW